MLEDMCVAFAELANVSFQVILFHFKNSFAFFKIIKTTKTVQVEKK